MRASVHGHVPLHLTLEVSGRCHAVHEDTAPIRSGPLDRIVRALAEPTEAGAKSKESNQMMRRHRSALAVALMKGVTRVTAKAKWQPNRLRNSKTRQREMRSRICASERTGRCRPTWRERATR